MLAPWLFYEENNNYMSSSSAINQAKSTTVLILPSSTFEHVFSSSLILLMPLFILLNHFNHSHLICSPLPPGLSRACTHANVKDFFFSMYNCFFLAGSVQCVYHLQVCIIWEIFSTVSNGNTIPHLALNTDFK